MERPNFEKQPSKNLNQKNLSWQERAVLPQEEREQLTTKTGREVLDFFRANAVEYSNISQMYEVLRGQRMIVRRESPEKILSMLEENESLHVDFPEGQRYSNAIIWKPEQGTRGLENTYLEGYAELNGVVAVIGFKQEAIQDIISLEDASQKFAGLDREYVRSIRGDIKPGDVLFVSLRIPAFAFPEANMTEAEHERYEEYTEDRKTQKKVEPQFIHRGFLFTKNLEKQ